MSSKESSVHNDTEHLWNSQVSPSSYNDKKLYLEHVFEQYKIYVETAEQVSNRRNIANTFFLTLNSFLLTAIGIFHEKGSMLSPSWLIIFPTIAAISLCFLWWRLILSYRQLNTAKYAVIDEFEKRLPTRPFVHSEWKKLGEGKDPKRYKSLTDLETFLPVLFGLLYIFGAIALMFTQS